MERSAEFSVFDNMSAYQCGMMGGRLARLMADAIKEALTEDAVSTIISEFRMGLDKDVVDAGDGDGATQFS